MYAYKGGNPVIGVTHENIWLALWRGNSRVGTKRRRIGFFILWFYCF
jgi:hypothetical protein